MESNITYKMFFEFITEAEITIELLYAKYGNELFSDLPEKNVEFLRSTLKGKMVEEGKVSDYPNTFAKQIMYRLNRLRKPVLDNSRPIEVANVAYSFQLKQYKDALYEFYVLKNTVSENEFVEYAKTNPVFMSEMGCLSKFYECGMSRLQALVDSGETFGFKLKPKALEHLKNPVKFIDVLVGNPESELVIYEKCFKNLELEIYGSNTFPLWFIRKVLLKGVNYQTTAERFKLYQ